MTSTAARTISTSAAAPPAPLHNIASAKFGPAAERWDAEQHRRLVICGLPPEYGRRRRRRGVDPAVRGLRFPRRAGPGARRQGRFGDSAWPGRRSRPPRPLTASLIALAWPDDRGEHVLERR